MASTSTFIPLGGSEIIDINSFRSRRSDGLLLPPPLLLDDEDEADIISTMQPITTNTKMKVGITAVQSTDC